MDFKQELGWHRNYQLLGSPEFFELSVDDRYRRSNGCGPRGILGALVPETMHGLDVSPGCDIHDDRYKRKDPKLRSDLEMLNNHIRIVSARGTADGKWALVKRLYRCVTYCAGVVLYGRTAYKNA